MQHRLFTLVLLGLTALTALPRTAGADGSAPFKGKFDFAILNVQRLPTGEFRIRASLKGRATILGNFEGEAVYDVNLTTGSFTGSAIKVAANGDELHETLTGNFTATGTAGDFVIVGGTGRFRRATGGGTYVTTWTNTELTTAEATFAASMEIGH